MFESGEKIVDVSVRDVRFPTSLEGHGSDAMHTNPDYSCVYVEVTTNHNQKGCGSTFTCGDGTDIVLAAAVKYKRFLLGRKCTDFVSNFATLWRELASETQIRWLGPEKGVVHLALAAVTNALWDLWAKAAGKPLWKMLVDMPPEQLVSTIDFRYIEDALTRSEAIDILKSMRASADEREKILLQQGCKAYTTSCGWMNYTDDVIRRRCQEALKDGFKFFKMKVGKSVENDCHRASVIRKEIGDDCFFAVDANQVWGVDETISWMKQLERFKPFWIEEPTSPDDILGHARIAIEMRKMGIKTATGEMCQNRCVAKQLFQANACDVFQLDAARVGGVSENLAILLMAKKFNVPVCPHAGGVGLCEMVNHMACFNFVSISGENVFVEYVDHLHEHFEHPCSVKDGSYVAPLGNNIGYSTEIKMSSIDAFSYPNGSEWQRMFREGLFKPPQP